MGNLISIDNLGIGGLNLDLPSHDLPPEVWSNARNVRFVDESVEFDQGCEVVYQNGSGNDCKTSPYGLWQVFDSGNTPIWLYGGADATAGTPQVFATDGATHKEITKSGGYNADIDYSFRWNGGALNGIPILNNGNGSDYPQQWDKDYSTPGLLTDLSNWPASTYARVIRPHRSFLVAYNVKKSGTWYRDMVKWSSSAAVGAVPSSWDPTDSSEANETQLSRTAGAILDALDLGAQQLIYKQDALYRMQYVGGAVIFRFEPLSLETGLLCTHGVAALDRVHVFVTSNVDMAVTDGVDLRSIGDKRVKRWLQAEVDEEYIDRVMVRNVPTRNEVWVGIPQTGSSGLITLFLIWNRTDNVFTLRDTTPISAFQFGTVPLDVDTRLWDSITPNYTWNNTEGTWNSKLDVASSRYLMLGKSDATTPKLLRGPSSYTDCDGNEYSGYVERLGLAIAGQDRQRQQIVDWGVTKQLVSVRPKIESAGNVDVYVYAQMLKDGPVQVQGPFSFDPTSEFKVDCNLTGRALGVRFQATSRFTLSGYGLDLRVRGRY